MSSAPPCSPSLAAASRTDRGLEVTTRPRWRARSTGAISQRRTVTPSRGRTWWSRPITTSTSAGARSRRSHHHAAESPASTAASPIDSIAATVRDAWVSSCSATWKTRCPAGRQAFVATRRRIVASLSPAARTCARLRTPCWARASRRSVASCAAVLMPGLTQRYAARIHPLPHMITISVTRPRRSAGFRHRDRDLQASTTGRSASAGAGGSTTSTSAPPVVPNLSTSRVVTPA